MTVTNWGFTSPNCSKSYAKQHSNLLPVHFVTHCWYGKWKRERIRDGRSTKAYQWYAESLPKIGSKWKVAWVWYHTYVAAVKAHPVYGPGTVGLGKMLAAAHGWVGSQFTCLYNLWNRESGWKPLAHNPSGAHGIPQALPGSKMGAGWYSNARVQITWGLGYIGGRYGTPCNADAFQRIHGWY